MQCPKCNQEVVNDAKICNYCGEKITVLKQKQVPKKNKWVSLVVIIIFIGLAVYNGLGEKSRGKNQQGIELLDTEGDYKSAIEQFQSASETMYDDEGKLTVLKNLAYAYWMDGQLDQAKESFKQALAAAPAESADYYLIAGEIALLDANPGLAEENYLKAQQLKPDDFQTNASLGVFYLGIDEVAQDYINYEKALQYNLAAYQANQELDVTKENLADTYFALAEYDKVIELYLQTNLSKKPYNNYMLGLAYYAQGDDTKARQYLQKAKDLGFNIEPEVAEFLNNQESE